MKELLKRTCTSFAISSFAGLVVNLLIDLGVNAFGGGPGFVSIPPAFASRFPTPVMAAYANVLLYGVIGAAFSALTVIFYADRLGFLVQYLIYFCATGTVLTFITAVLWELQSIPVALYATMAGYALAFVIMGVFQFRQARRDIARINEWIDGEA